MNNEIFSISEAAEYLGVFPLTIRNWERKRFIKCFRTPCGHRRFKKSELDRIKGINGINTTFRKAIERLEELDFKNGQKQAIGGIIIDLKDISENI